MSFFCVLYTYVEFGENYNTIDNNILTLLPKKKKL